MGLGSRIVIGLIGMLSGILFLSIALNPPPDAIVGGLYACAVFCFLIVVACIGGLVGNIALRLIAATVCLLYVWYVVTEVFRPDPVFDSGRKSQPSILNAILGFCFFGIPAGGFAIFGGKFLSGKGSDRDEVSAGLERVTWKTLDGSFSEPKEAVRALDPRLKPQELYEVDRVKAEEILRQVLQFDLAYDIEVWDAQEVSSFIERFMKETAADDLGTRFFSNRNPMFDREAEDGYEGWSPATDSTFDAGIVVLGPEKCGLVWVEDED